jgi:hypothetical protein
MAHPLLTIVYGNCLFFNYGPLEFNYGPPTSHRSLRSLLRNKSESLLLELLTHVMWLYHYIICCVYHPFSSEVRDCSELILFEM